MLLWCLVLATPVGATVHCVNSVATINTAYGLANSSANGSVHEIRVRTGTYNFSSNLSFGGIGEDKTFELTRGWNSDCSARTINPANTVFNGAGQGVTQFSFSGNHRHFRVEGIRFQNFGSFFLFENICPFGQSCADTESVRVRYNHFRQGTEALIVANDAQVYLVSNNLFESMTGPSGASDEATVKLGYANEDAIPQVSYNTFSLACAVAVKPAIWLHSERSSSLFSHNIVATSGCNAPIFVDSDFNGKAWRFRHNLYPSVNAGLPPAGGSSGNLIGLNPQFVSTTDFHLRESAPVSPAINAGQSPVQASQDGLSVPAQDLDGPAGGRLVGSNYDMGAYESAVNDATVLLVTNASDSGSGSLRAAITSANATPGLQKIHFNIPGGCSTPNVIALQSELPDITDSVEIDGYSEPDASPNTLSLGSDAVICVVLFGLNASLGQALQVPQGVPAGTSLTVKGLAFSSFENAVAIRLRGGSNHRIQGNAIGGIGPGALGDLFSNAIGVQVRSEAQNALIGGPEPEDRNSIGAATTSAVSLIDASSNGHTIQNNYIGLAASGTSPSPIGNGATGNGIFASASANLRILDNVIAAVPNGAAISITGATATGYEIARNKLGTSASSIPTAAFRNGSGITITNGSGGHQIGGILNQSVSNTITNSSGAGVHLTTSAGVGTTVRPNRIFGNGVDTNALGIDLGDLGALPNDSGDGDGGPNNGQNKPVVTDSLVNADGTRQVSGLLSTQTGSYIIDIYRSPDCSSGRGNMLNLVGTEFVTNVLGSVGFDVTVPGGTPGLLTAVATRISNGDSSEVSDCFLEAHQTTTTIVSDTPEPSQFGQILTVGVQVSSATGGTPTGAVTVSNAGFSCIITLSGGNGSCQLPSNAVGTGTITADYAGTFGFLPSSDSESHIYVAANTTTTIVSDSPDPSQVGQAYTVQVEVHRQHDNAVFNGGTVTVSDGTGQTCQTA
ncbi:MAG: Ig-like domain repeat protein, partial [Xanthomonadales bacterium]|nr:Ig-like domain repeat protein [Xanthomonadales bacterium]